MTKVSTSESPVLQGRGHQWLAELEAGSHHGMEEEEVVDFPSFCGARELGCFCSQSPICMEQGPALVYAPELWETQTPSLLGVRPNRENCWVSQLFSHGARMAGHSCASVSPGG